jgi:CRISPR-associated protein Cmx8
MSEEKKPLEAIVLQIVSTYVNRKLESKHGLSWSNVKKGEGDKAEYGEKKGKIAREAFLAVRARTGADFIDYFASTLCSVPQYQNDENFMFLSRELHQSTAKIRTLTLLALSARS